MIPTAFLQAWSTKAPWPDLRQVEQDLIICRALCDLFNAPALAGKIAFRGGTAIHKLLFKQPLRYSEDIDLVQAHPEPIGGTVDAIRAALSWLGKCSREQAGHSMHLVFKFTPESRCAGDAQAEGRDQHSGAREPAWYSTLIRLPWKTTGTAERRRSPPSSPRNCSARSCAHCCSGAGTVTCSICTRDSNSCRWLRRRVIACFDHYLALEGKPITRAMAEQRMLEKLTRSLTEDVAPMLPASVRWSDADAIQAFERVWTELIARIGGDRWKLSDAVIEELRAKRYPALLMPRDRKRPQ